MYSSRLGLPYLQPSQAQKHVTHNEALQKLDLITQISVECFALDDPPTALEAGQTFALGANPTGEWSGHAFDLACWGGEAWLFITPQRGWIAWGRCEQELRVWNGADWVATTHTPEHAPFFGISAIADETNRLSVAADATLFSHAGAGHQLKVNKATSSDTAALLFQSVWQGHAELGLAGDNMFTVKVSDDGQTWHNSLSIDPSDQSISLTAGSSEVRVSDTGTAIEGTLTGSAVQASVLDDGDGKVMRVGAFGLGSNTAPITTDIDLSNSISTGFYFVENTASGDKPEASGHLIQMRNGGDTTYADTLHAFVTRSNLWLRGFDGGAWSDWTGLGGVHGSNQNGTFLKLPDGTLLCSVTGNLTRVAAGMLSFTWTFPANFLAGSAQEIVVLPVWDRVAAWAIAPGPNEISTPFIASTTENSTTVQARLLPNPSNSFASTDAGFTRVLAIGRWK
ncbi:DUF2793 domain-containing protein [Shimia sp. SDUM112013]|uniref:DUF2793 domain-containing protein n=1 Tax=Shimia sp. SDUM112013 TaxID=3136160 RepID=UPI0032EBD34F